MLNPAQTSVQTSGLHHRTAASQRTTRQIAVAKGLMPMRPQLSQDVCQIRFGKVDKPAPEAFLKHYAPISDRQLEALTESLEDRVQNPKSPQEIQKQISKGNDDAPGLDIVGLPEPYGKGLRANRDFQKGEVVINFKSGFFAPAFYQVPLSKIHHHQRVLDLGHYVVLTPDTALTWPKPQKISYLNHAVENAFAPERPSNVEVSYEKHGYVALHPIKKGDIIFSDYNNGEYQTPEDQQVFNTIHPFLKQA